MESKHRCRKRLYRGSVLMPAACIALLYFASCETVPEDPASFVSAELLGVVFDGQASPVQGMEITINETVVFSDVNGRFTIPQLLRGAHEVTAVKQGYESIHVTFDFIQRTQFLYLTTHSLQDYLSEAEQALARKDFQQAGDILAKAAAIDADQPVVMFLRSLVFSSIGDYDSAVDVLTAIVENGIREEAVFLLLIDAAIANPAVRGRVMDLIGQNPGSAANPRIAAKLEKLESSPQAEP